MALTSTERSRRFREKLKNDPLRLAEYQEKERKRYHESKDLIKEKTNRGKRRERKKWRLLKQQQRRKLKEVAHTLTPPQSPDHQNDEELHQIPAPSRQKIQSKKERNRKKIKCYRENKMLKKKLENAENKARMFRK